MKKLTTVLLLAGIISCEKLTLITEKGRNTMSCKVNGKVFKAEHIFDIFGGDSPQAGYRNGEFTLYGSENPNKNELRRVLYLKLVEVYSTTSYKLSDQNIGHGYIQYSRYSEDSHNFSTDSTHTGILKINKLDTINKIISGTFNFTAKTFRHVRNEVNNLPDVKISDGRFDMKYN